MITKHQLEQAVVIFEHLYNYNHMRDSGYKNNLKLYTRDGFKVSSIDVSAPSPNEFDHRYDGYKSAGPFKRIENTKFGFEVDYAVVENLNLEECFFVVYHRENKRYIANACFDPGEFYRIDYQDLNFLYNQIAL